MLNYYQILGISATASQKEIVSAYRSKCKLLHPDVNPSADATEQMQMVNEAYHTLADAYLRRQYDERYSYSSSIENNSCSESYERTGMPGRNGGTKSLVVRIPVVVGMQSIGMIKRTRKLQVGLGILWP